MGEAALQLDPIGPQPGPQEEFLATPADIAIFGGSAGPGKTWALLFEPIRHISNSRFGAVAFRRILPDIKGEGGMWEEGGDLYEPLGAEANEQGKSYTFPSGAKVSFRHMQYAKDRFNYKGWQIPLILWDQLEEFEESQFWYLMSRNRSTCGIRPYVRATVNPAPDTWISELIQWWWDPETGYPIPERSGALRYMFRLGDGIIWGDSPEEVKAMLPPEELERVERVEAAGGRSILSLTFIGATVYDNKILMREDPDYLGKLLALPEEERMILLEGNWKYRAPGGHFSEEEFRFHDRTDWDAHRLYAILDAAYEGKADSDSSALGVFGVSQDAWVRSFDSFEKRIPDDELIDEIFRIMEKWKPRGLDTLHLECHKSFRTALKAEMRLRDFHFNLVELKAAGVNKDAHILGFRTQLHRFEFRKPQEMWLVRRMLDYKPKSEIESGQSRPPVDGPDMLAYAGLVCTWDPKKSKTSRAEATGNPVQDRLQKQLRKRGKK